jgi:hypothetical protein
VLHLIEGPVSPGLPGVPSRPLPSRQPRRRIVNYTRTTRIGEPDLAIFETRWVYFLRSLRGGITRLTPLLLPLHVSGNPRFFEAFAAFFPEPLDTAV